ncbi:MAG: hypothetical protein FWC84_02115 [Alphaproteobacteria bacterium]|nr:hypothetical protein [Alphaproteobacteria bacterium]
MGAADQQRFLDEWKKLGFFFPDTGPALKILAGLTMPDMIRALQALTSSDQGTVYSASLLHGSAIGVPGVNRIAFAYYVVNKFEIVDLGISLDEVNDGREALGCTRLDDKGVQGEIDRLMIGARKGIAAKDPDYTRFLNGLEGAAIGCCGAVRAAWLHAANYDRTMPRASLIANLAAAAHYLLARAEVCAAHASSGQMKIIIDGYDTKKRITISLGDVHLDSMAQVAGNPPFPPDFAVRAWAYKGADHGEADRSTCNKDASPPWISPKVGGNEWGIG